MAYFLKNSLIIQLLLRIVGFVNVCYDDSSVKKISGIYKQSKVYSIFKSYADKEPYFIHSGAYKMLMGLWGLFDKLADSVHNFFARIIKGSVFFDKAAKIFSGYEAALYIPMWYVFLDYGIRTYIPRFGSLWDKLLFLFLIMLWGVKYVAYRKEVSIKITPLDLPIMIFISAMTLALIVQSPDLSISFQGYRAVCQNILWYFIVLQLLKTRNGAEKMCLMFVCAAFLIALHGVYQYVIGVEMPASWIDQGEMAVRTRVFSIIGSPNILGSLMVLAIPISVSFMFASKETVKKIFFMGITVVMLAALVFSFSRGAWIGFAACAAVYALLKDKRLIVPVIVIGLLAAALVPSIGDRILYMLSPEYIESSLRGGRLVRWFTGAEILNSTLSNLIIGTGLGHFGGAVAMNREITRLVGIDVIKTFYMDNYYLKTAVETGLFGLAAFVMLMYQVVICSYRTIRKTSDSRLRIMEIGVMSGLLGIIVHNLIENVFEVPMITSYFWMLAAVMMFLWFFNEDFADAKS